MICETFHKKRGHEVKTGVVKPVFDIMSLLIQALYKMLIDVSQRASNVAPP